MEQTTLFGDARETTLTERQQYALEQIEEADGGLASDELGAVMHERRGKHGRGQRCSWCAEEGKGVAGELRRKGMVVRKRSGMWMSTRPLGPGDAAPIAASPEPSGPGVDEQVETGSAADDRLLTGRPTPTDGCQPGSSERHGESAGEPAGFRDTRAPARSEDPDESFGDWMARL